MAKIKKIKSKVYDKWAAGYYSDGYKSRATSYSNSSFWMDDDFLTTAPKEEGIGSSIDYVKLAAYKRAIANFVKIVTNKDDINVRYSSGGDSYTDGKDVVISSKLDEKEFDSTVGLALHEGSHIALTNFKFINHLFQDFNRHVKETSIVPEILEFHKSIDPSFSAYSDMTHYISSRLKDLINIIEDRRIDRFVYDSAPGYQGYYTALYSKYFNAKEIDMALLKGVKNKNTWDDYIFHICNFANPNRNLKTLPMLSQIWDVISIPTISRLKSTKEVADVALHVYKIIVAELEKEKGAKKNPDQSEEEKSSAKNGENSLGSSNGDENNDMGGMDDNLDLGGKGSNSNSDSNAAPKMSDKELRALEKAIKKQNEFLKGDIDKKKLSKKDANKINAAADSNMSYTAVGGGTHDAEGKPISHNKTNCMVVKGMNESLLESGLMGGHYYAHNKKYIELYDREDYIADGIVLGTHLGKRLKTRDEERNIINTRLDSGRIDRRLISELGFGNDRIFSQTIHQTVTPSIIHISIDASGSMSGERLKTAIKTAVAIAKASSMIQSVDCVISLRGTFATNGTTTPLMWVAYDSRKDSFTTIREKFYGLSANHLTPEGLCFEAIMKDILEAANGKEAYFINLSDGEPGYSECNGRSSRGQSGSFEYHGRYALSHTRAQVDKMRKAGINVLSYFISQSANTSSMEKFKYMYGNDASFINTEDLNQLSNSINKLFERK